MTSEVSVGRVGRAHGLDGSFYVTRPRSAALLEGQVLHVGDGEAAITRRAGTDARPIVRIEGCEDRAAAEELRGAELRIARADLPALGEDEWWAEDLEGCHVVDGEREIGTVRRLLALPSCEALEVARVQGEDLLVPLVRDAVRSVDVQAGRIDVDVGFLAVADDE